MIERFEKISPHMIVPTSDLFKLAYDKYAIGAYNIKQPRTNPRSFRRAKCILKRFLRYTWITATEETCSECIDSGFFSSVMIDASHDQFEENVAITKRVVERAHAKGMSVEAELGQLGGVEEDVKVDEGSACLKAISGIQ